MRLQHLLILVLLVGGIVPLAVNSFMLIRQNRGLLVTQEMSNLTRSARSLSVELNGYLVNASGLLEQLGRSVLAAPASSNLVDRLREPWVSALAQELLAGHPELLVVRVLNAEGVGPQYTASAPPGLKEALDDAFVGVGDGSEIVYRFYGSAAEGPPLAVVAIPVEGGGERLVVEGVVGLDLLETFSRREATDDVGVFLVARPATVLWSVGADAAVERALAESDLMRRFVDVPHAQTGRYELPVGGKSIEMLTRVSPVEAPGWGVVVQKPASKAFIAISQMVYNTALSTGVLIALALALALLATRKVSRPIRELSRMSEEIADGSFGKRVEINPVGSEIDALARNFNLMSSHVESSVERLRQAAQQNQELFIGSMRAFITAVDAKDPYTRGHSERVAAHSRTIARQLGLEPEMEHRVWVGALLHDVGKIGIEDSILTKEGVLTSEEYEEMKRHPVIGAEIMSRIRQLRHMIPAIRWHHEAWNGKGYPDGLVGERIPLMARIVGVADTFDAITTNRPYQKAYEPAFAVQKIRELAGQRFDAKVVTAFLKAFEAGRIQLRRPNAPAVGNPPRSEASAVS